MKKLYSALLIFLVVSVGCLKANEIVVPVTNGRVLFSDTIGTSLNKEAIKERLEKWTEENLKPNDQRHIMGSVNDSVNNVMSTVVFEYMEMDKNNWMTHFIYIRYHLTMKYKDNQCIVTFGRIDYAENLRDLNNPMKGEDILIKKKFKRLGYKDASDKIIKYTVDKVDDIFGSLRKVLE